MSVIVVMLIGVELLGFVGKGAQRWLDLGPIRLQPSEFMKPAIVSTLARFYELVPAGDIRTMAGDLAGAAAARRPGLPDPPSARPRHLHHGHAVRGDRHVPRRTAVVALRRPRRQRSRSPRRSSTRCSTAISASGSTSSSIPESDPLGAGYHIAQSKIAIGSGGIWGKGFLNGSQSHLDYLPEGHTDFVFATMAEEWGLVGGVLLIFAFALVIRWGMRVSPNARTRFAQLAAAGLSATIFFYVSINLMMVMGLAPVVGVPLPLVSFGGSAVMTVMLCLGLLMALERQQRTQSRRSVGKLNASGCAPPTPMLPAPPLQGEKVRRSIRLTAVDA